VSCYEELVFKKLWPPLPKTNPSSHDLSHKMICSVYFMTPKVGGGRQKEPQTLETALVTGSRK
jgi:hypothetical protein